jgi:hypothetical protein
VVRGILPSDRMGPSNLWRKATALGTWVLGENLEPRHFVSIALIAPGLAAISGRAGGR